MFGLELMTCIANLAWRDLLLFACLINWIFQQKLAVLEKVLCVSYVTCRNSLGGGYTPLYISVCRPTIYAFLYNIKSAIISVDVSTKLSSVACNCVKIRDLKLKVKKVHQLY